MECFIVYVGDLTNMSFLYLLWKCTEEQEHGGQLRDRCG